MIMSNILYFSVFSSTVVPSTSIINHHRNLSVLHFEFKYLKKGDLCRTPIINFRTKAAQNATSVSFQISFRFGSSLLLLPKHIFKHAECKFDPDKPSYGYCICPDLMLANGYTANFTMTQMMDGGHTRLENLSMVVNYISKSVH